MSKHLSKEMIKILQFDLELYKESITVRYMVLLVSVCLFPKHKSPRNDFIHELVSDSIEFLSRNNVIIKKKLISVKYKIISALSSSAVPVKHSIIQT